MGQPEEQHRIKSHRGAESGYTFVTRIQALDVKVAYVHSPSHRRCAAAMQNPYISDRMPGCRGYTFFDMVTQRSASRAQSRGCMRYGGPTGYDFIASVTDT